MDELKSMLVQVRRAAGAVVGIGASAGGLESFSELVNALPSPTLGLSWQVPR